VKSPLRILHLEDSPRDATFIAATLERAGIACAITRVESRDNFLSELERGETDLILSDFSLPSFDGLSASKIVCEKWPDIPFILVSGTLGEDQAIDSLKGGATDYVLKGHISRLAPAVQRAMSEVEDREKARKVIQNERSFSEASVNSLPGLFYLYDKEGNFMRWNKNFERISGYSTEEISGMGPLDFFLGDDRDHIAKKIDEVFAKGSANAEAEFVAKDGTRNSYYFTAHRIQMDGKPCLIGTGIDISERKKLEAQFIEAQKMEGLGQLAGGVAHDFNNILSVIMCYSEVILRELDSESPLRKYTEEIQEASQRAAGLTRQLLVFSRKETVQAVVLDLNDVVTDLDKMLRRLVDENIEMTVSLGKKIGHIKADSGYVGQVLMNLVVNARDVMPNGGKLSIETNNITLDENYAKVHPGTVPGNYVMLSISDTGTGMTDEVKAHLFEAFFTTKPSGQGTGLGLSTCQSIVQQSGGHIDVQSEVGNGTIFNIYFPRVEQPLDVVAKPLQSGPLPRGTETLLIVEDDPSVRHLALRILEGQGYKVLSASNGQDALHVAREHKGSPIGLVVTDVVMPLMGGKIMAEWLKTTYPGIKVLFTSGYTDGAITHHGILEEGIEFLQKPYTRAVLACKVRELLDNGPVRTRDVVSAEGIAATVLDANQRKPVDVSPSDKGRGESEPSFRSVLDEKKAGCLTDTPVR
jgi:two-component system cell cycle sensor histidine kinase/response regulator CckA